MWVHQAAIHFDSVCLCVCVQDAGLDSTVDEVWVSATDAHLNGDWLWYDGTALTDTSFATSKSSGGFRAKEKVTLDSHI